MELHEIHFYRMGDDPGIVPHPSRRRIAPPVRPIIQRALVHVHADEFVRELRIEITRKLHRISQRFFAMIKPHTEYFAAVRLQPAQSPQLQDCGESHCLPKAREASHAAPPSAQINNAVQPGFRIRQLSLVNN